MFLPLRIGLDFCEHVVERLVRVICRDITERADVAVFGEIGNLGLVVLIWKLPMARARTWIHYHGEVDVGVLLRTDPNRQRAGLGIEVGGICTYAV